MIAEQQVSVVVPAFNAEKTLDATLTSVRRQTYRNLDIVVVDDGSVDRTAALAAAHAALDPRVRVVSVSNGGVARARNIGFAESRGAFVAPIDADDLWHPEKISRQMEVMQSGGPRMGFVYTYYRRIDERDRVLGSGEARNFAGCVYLRSLLTNFVGNGSSLLIRRAAFEDAGGYETGLHEQGVQGCEDYLLQTLIARSWTVGLVPEYLTGYRRTAGAMSGNLEGMARSHLLMLEHVRRQFPETPADVLAAAEAAMRSRLAVTHLLPKLRPMPAAAELARAVRRSPAAALAAAQHLLRERVIGMVRRRLARVVPPKPVPATGFLARDPSADRPPELPHHLDRWVAAAAAREETFFAAKPLRSPSRCFVPEPVRQRTARKAL